MKINVVESINIKQVDLRQLRHSKGLSLKKLSELSGINYVYITLIERGKVKVVGNEVWTKLKKGLDKA